MHPSSVMLRAPRRSYGSLKPDDVCACGGLVLVYADESRHHYGRCNA